MNVIAVGICMALLFAAGEAAAAGVPIGVVKTVKGEAFIEREQKATPAKIGDTLLEKDELVTGRDGAMGVIMKDDAVLSIGPNSRLQFADFLFEPAERKLSTVNRLKRGTLVYLSGLIAKLKPEAVRFETKTAVCGIRGTYLAISEEGDALQEFTEEQAAKLNALIRSGEKKEAEGAR
ncbi:MAG: FecR family protein [Syntrophales bacterium]